MDQAMKLNFSGTEMLHCRKVYILTLTIILLMVSF